MGLLALAVGGRGLVDPAAPVLRADDEALLRGRAAFETLRVYGGRPFRLRQHLDRLAASAERVGLAPIDAGEFESLAAEALERAAAPDAVLRLLWTAGPEAGRPVALALVSAIPEYLEPMRAQGIALVSLLGARADEPWLLGGVKSTSYAVNMAAEAEAKRRGADDALFVDRAGIVLEGPVTNMWWRKGDTLFTPALELGVLAGVTRAVLFERAGALGYRVEEGFYSLDALHEADEAFTSSSVREVLPVVMLDGRSVGDGKPGPAAVSFQSALRSAAAGGASGSPGDIRRFLERE
jgi:4-amino-4-deoxychorismate lyase